MIVILFVWSKKRIDNIVASSHLPLHSLHKCFCRLCSQMELKEGFGLEGFGLEGFGLEGFGLEGFGLEGFGLEGFGLYVFGLKGFGLEGCVCRCKKKIVDSYSICM